MIIGIPSWNFISWTFSHCTSPPSHDFLSTIPLLPHLIATQHHPIDPWDALFAPIFLDIPFGFTLSCENEHLLCTSIKRFVTWYQIHELKYDQGKKKVVTPPMIQLPRSVLVWEPYAALTVQLCALALFPSQHMKRAHLKKSFRAIGHVVQPFSSCLCQQHAAHSLLSAVFADRNPREFLL